MDLRDLNTEDGHVRIIAGLRAEIEGLKVGSLLPFFRGINLRSIYSFMVANVLYHLLSDAAARREANPCGSGVESEQRDTEAERSQREDRAADRSQNSAATAAATIYWVVGCGEAGKKTLP